MTITNINEVIDQFQNGAWMAPDELDMLMFAGFFRTQAEYEMAVYTNDSL